MKNTKLKRIMSMALALLMMTSMVADVFSVKAFATGEENQPQTVETEVETTEEDTDRNPSGEENENPPAEPTASPEPTPAKCSYCGGEHELADCKVKCSVHGTEHNDTQCTRHLTCELCDETGHETDDCPQQCATHGTKHMKEYCPDLNLKCTLCKQTGHEAEDCPDRCSEHGTSHLEKDCPSNFKTNDKVYITNYQVVNGKGKALAKVEPGDEVIVAVTVIDERVKAEDFGITGNNVQTNRIHATMSQGAFSIASASKVTAKLRNNVSVNGESGPYNALCYTVEFRDVTYLGGTPDFSFTISYTDYSGDPVKSNNIPLPYPQETLAMSVTQATDDVPAPTIILNSANYGKVAIIGEAFNLSTVATNTSENLELENVSVKVELPSGINMASGNSQVLVGDVGKSGTIEHTFNLIAEGVGNDITSLPVKLVYTFEAFVNGKRTQFTSEQDISINVQQPTRFSIQSLMSDMEMYMGYESYASASLVNKGKTTVYNVTAELVSDTLQAYDVEFLGNIAPGASAEAAFDFTATQLGTATGKILITYEDASGTETTMEQDFTIEVIEEPVWDEPMYTEPVPVEKENNAVPFIIAGVFIVAAAGGFVFYKKKKTEKLAELEDEDEDI